jgi:rod shape-determining protein MreC
MVVDRRAVLEGGRAFPGWLGSILDAAAPVQHAIARPFEAVRDTWDGYISLLHVKLQNDELEREVARLSEENLQLREALIASGRLQRIADMREHYEVPMLPAELVGVDASPWFRSVLIDRGRDRGVFSGMPVISEQGLVGIITATSQRSAKAMLVLDRQTSVDGVIQRSRSRGTVRGRGGDELEFEFVARNSDVQVNDLVITSGLGGVYPKGLFIGTISEVSEPGTQLLRRATIRPAVDFGRLEEVFVMLRRGPTMELLYSTRVGDEPPPGESAGPSS